VRFHALLNCGAILGAAATGIVLHAGISWRGIWPGVAAAALVVGLWVFSTDSTRSTAGEVVADAHGIEYEDAAGEDTEGRRHPIRRIGHDGFLVLIGIFAQAEITEGGVDTWGVLSLRNHLAAGVLLGPCSGHWS
jgi:hypothetical protein